VGIARQPVAVDLATKAVQLIFTDAALQKCAGIDARGRVALYEEQVLPLGMSGPFQRWLKPIPNILAND